MFERFTDQARHCVVLAQEEARGMRHNYIGTEHILLGLLADHNSVAYTVLSSAVDDTETIRAMVAEHAPPGAKQIEGHIPFTPRAKKTLETALREALQMGHSYIGTEHILLGLSRVDDGIAADILKKVGLDSGTIRDVVIELIGDGQGESAEKQKGKRTGGGGKDEPAVKGSKLLEQFGRNLTEMAKEGKLDPVIGRDKEIERLMQILARRTKNNPVLIGEPGVGKTAVVEGLVLRIVSGNIPETLAGAQVYTLDLSNVVAGSRYRGDFEEKMKKVLKEVSNNPKMILFIDEMHTIMGAGAAEGSIDAASILKPVLARGEIKVIGATTLEEYRKHVEKDPAMERRFQPVRVEEPTADQAILILQGLRDRYESHHKVAYTDAALASAVRMSQRYVSDRFLPDKAIDLIDEAGARLYIASINVPAGVHDYDARIASAVMMKEASLETQDYEAAARYRDEERQLVEEKTQMEEQWRRARQEKDEIPKVDDQMIAEILANATGIPVFKLSEEDTRMLLKMEEKLRERVIGQDEAIVSVARAVRRTRAGLKDPNRPGGSFIFAGPSGVGKTEVCKALAEFLFGTEDALITLDMGEYSEKHAVSRMFGAPPGYVGYDEGGQLTEKVRRKPFSVVLFDEVEKAHPDVFNSLLQVLEEGRLTDSQGRHIDFKNTIIIMTSNLGTKDIGAKLNVGFQPSGDTANRHERLKGKVTEELKNHFRPEFLNRVDDIVVFHQLSEDDIIQIVNIMVSKLDEKLRNQDMGLELTRDAELFLAQKGYDPVYGARPLRRAIQKYVEDPLSERLLNGDFKPGEMIVADAPPVDGEDADALVFSALVPPTVPPDLAVPV